MDTVGEVQLIAGMTSTIYCKLRDKFTVFSTGKVNINDADLVVLEGILCGSIEDEALQFQTCFMPQAPAMIAPMTSALLVLDQCRKVKKELYSTPFTSFVKFKTFFQKYPVSIGDGTQLPVQWTTVGQNLGVNTKMVRIEATGKYRHASKKMTTIVDTSTGAIVHSRLE